MKSEWAVGAKIIFRTRAIDGTATAVWVKLRTPSGAESELTAAYSSAVRMWVTDEYRLEEAGDYVYKWLGRRASDAADESSGASHDIVLRVRDTVFADD